MLKCAPMPRGLFRKITPRSETLHSHWALKPFKRFLGDPRLWSLQRRTVTPAFGAGLAICFVPLPIHIPLAALVAIVARINIPTIMVALIAVNPLTIVPVYFLAYWVGAHLLGTDPGAFQFALTWEWVQTQLVLIWKPFLLGCLVCGSVAAFVGYWSLEFAWRFSATHRYQKRPGRLRTLRSRIDQNSTLEG